MEDIRNIIPQDLSKEDSTNKVNNYIDTWIRTQLMIKRAELNLKDEEQDVQKLLEEYRTSLIIYKYKQKFIEQKLDTNVTDTEIDEFYKQHTSEFVLNSNIVKANLIKILKSAKDLNTIKYLFKSNNDMDQLRLEDLCMQNGGTINKFDEDWVSFSDIMRNLPSRVDDPENYLRSNRYFETSDTVHQYFLKINAYKLVNETSPLEIVRNNIRMMVLNKRKINLIEELENSIYKNAYDRNHIEVFKKK